MTAFSRWPSLTATPLLFLAFLFLSSCGLFNTDVELNVTNRLAVLGATEITFTIDGGRRTAISFLESRRFTISSGEHDVRAVYTGDLVTGFVAATIDVNTDVQLDVFSSGFNLREQ